MTEAEQQLTGLAQGHQLPGFTQCIPGPGSGQDKEATRNNTVSLPGANTARTTGPLASHIPRRQGLCVSLYPGASLPPVCPAVTLLPVINANQAVSPHHALSMTPAETTSPQGYGITSRGRTMTTPVLPANRNCVDAASLRREV